jgi:hypothetical protein
MIPEHNVGIPERTRPFRGRCLTICGIGALALMMFRPSEVESFGFIGARWDLQPGQSLRYTLNPVGSEDIINGSEIDAIRSAFSSWTQVSCSYLTFEELAWTGAPSLGEDGQNRIYWIENAADWVTSEGTLALTVTLSGPGGQIIDADIVANGANYRWTTLASEVTPGTPPPGELPFVDVETVFVHEIGHFFGLAHSSDSQAVMFATVQEPVRRLPTTDDIRGICALYPNGEPAPGEGSGLPTGANCTTNTACASGVCVNDSLVGRSYCSEACLISNPSVCPDDFTCEQTEAGAFCLAPVVDDFCDQCSAGSQCATGLCVTVAFVNNTEPFCTVSCDPTDPNPEQCPPNFSCRLTQQGATQLGACAPNSGVCEPAGKGGKNESCFANGTCKSGLRCLDYFPGQNDGLRYCYPICDVGQVGQSCGTDFSVCDRSAQFPEAAVCFPVSGPRQPCIPEICQVGSLCLFDETLGVNSAICYQICDTNPSVCPANTQCVGFPGVRAVCVPNEGFKDLAEPCLADTECVSGLCRTYADAKLCTQPCATNASGECGPGLFCLPQTNSTQGLCWPRNSTPSVPPEVPPSCTCDTTNDCDPNCACDPECSDGCGCAVVDSESSNGAEAWPLALALGLGLGLFGFVRARARAQGRLTKSSNTRANNKGHGPQRKNLIP